MTCFLLGPDPARTTVKAFKNMVSRIWSRSWLTKSRQCKQSHRKGKRLEEEISRCITSFKIGMSRLLFSPQSLSIILVKGLAVFFLHPPCHAVHLLTFPPCIEAISLVLCITKCKVLLLLFYIYLPAAETVPGMPCSGTGVAQQSEKIDSTFFSPPHHSSST